MAKTKKKVKVAKKSAVKKSIRKKAPARKASARGKKAKASMTQVVPAVLQTLAQLEKAFNQQEKANQKLVKGFEAKFKKAQTQKEKAEAKLQKAQQKTEGKDIPAAKLKPLQKAVDNAQTACAAMETEISNAKHKLSSLKHELTILKEARTFVEKLNQEELQQNSVTKLQAGKSKKAEVAMQLDKTELSSKTKLDHSKETAKEGSEGNFEEDEE